METCVIYTRISPRPTEINGAGERVAIQDTIQNQQDKCHAYAEQQGWKVVGDYSDYLKSGADSTRPGALEAIDAACAHQCVLLCESPDRFTRDPVWGIMQRQRLAKAGASLHYISGGEVDLESPEGRMLANILDTVASYQREANGARIKRSKNLARQRGEYLGGNNPPIGYTIRRVGGRRVLEVKPTEVWLAVRIWEWNEQVAGRRRIANFLNRMGVVPFRRAVKGKGRGQKLEALEWSANSVKNWRDAGEKWLRSHGQPGTDRQLSLSPVELMRELFPDFSPENEPLVLARCPAADTIDTHGEIDQEPDWF